MGIVKYNIEFIRKEFEKEGYKVLSGEYINDAHKIEYVCPYGHYYTTAWSAWRAGNRCAICRPRGRPKGTKLSNKTKSKIAESMIGKIKSKSTKEKTSRSLLEYFNTFDKINELCSSLGYTFINTTYSGAYEQIQYVDNTGVLHDTSWSSFYQMITPVKYDTYSDRLSYADPVRKAVDNSMLLETRCAYCGKWFKPTSMYVNARINCLEGKGAGECRLYCSEGCKTACPIYNQVLWPKGFKDATSREVQPELRQLVLERDDYTCQKCGKIIEDVELHCHHIDPVANNPIESADVDNCVTFCINCHKEVHKQSGCKYHELRCN